MYIPKYKELGFESYEQYLSSEHWSVVKEKYKKSGRPLRCFVCDSPNYILHHLTYRHLGVELLDDLLPLCFGHHNTLHLIMTDGMNKWNPPRILQRLTTLTRTERKTRCAEFTNRNVPLRNRRFAEQYRVPSAVISEDTKKRKYKKVIQARSEKLQAVIDLAISTLSGEEFSQLANIFKGLRRKRKKFMRFRSAAADSNIN